MSLPSYLGSLQERLDSVRASLSAELEHISQELAERRPSPDQWSIAEVCAHLALVEKGNSRVLEILTEKARAEGIYMEGGPSWDMTAPTLPEKLQAPEKVVPRANTTFQQAWTDLQGYRQKVIAGLPGLANLDLGRLLFPHPVFGDLNLHQWLEFLPVHEAHHVKQIQRIKQQFGC